MDIDQISDIATIHSGTEDQHDHIPIKDGIVNIYKTQIIIVERKQKEIQIVNKRRRIFIDQNDINSENAIIDILRRYIPEKGHIGIYCKLNDHQWNVVQQNIINLYSNNNDLKFIKCTQLVIDLINEEQCYDKIREIHENTNHRGITENYAEIKNKFYYNGILKLITKYINNCDICNQIKYDRNPVKFLISETPTDINEIIHIDVFTIKKRIFFTTIDKFSKHLYVKETSDKNAITFIQLLRERNANLGKPLKIIADNEFNMVNIKEYLKSENIEIHFTSPKSHTGNSDMNRCHSTLLEHIRTLIKTKPSLNISEQVLKSVEYYNNTIHSTIETKPLNVQYGNIEKSKLLKIITDKKRKWIKYHNKTREPKPEIENGEIYIKNYESERHKDKPKFRKVKVTLDKNGNIFANKTKHNKHQTKIHPSRIKRTKKV
ncbi:unnamed protein product [Hermetia illucens]|uniref:RNA-directed DNA polymerase n=1 Tax=Hermetia illucens TaxID=343691 RepID=A0A7R8UDH5_HERIL|nr:unnamed protein product [Hermetia illucens]